MPDARNFGDGLTPVEQPKGVWIVYSFSSNGYVTNSVHLSELEALRVVARQGYGNAAFVSFGEEISDVVTR